MSRRSAPLLTAGQRFNRLVAVEFVGRSGKSIPQWKFTCDCGLAHICSAYDVIKGRTTSCGCRQREVQAMSGRSPTHGMRYSPEYTSWCSMIQRCTNPKSTYFSDYGGRGISVHEPWLDSFEAFYAYIGPRPSKSHTLDRYPDPNGNYEPGNIRWATRTEQARNRRNTRQVFYRGTAMTLALACDLAGKNISTVASRLDRGWPSDRAFT